MVLGKRWLFSIVNGTEIPPLEKGRKSSVMSADNFAKQFGTRSGQTFRSTRMKDINRTAAGQKIN